MQNISRDDEFHLRENRKLLFVRMASHSERRFETEALGNSEIAYSGCWRTGVLL